MFVYNEQYSEKQGNIAKYFNEEKTMAKKRFWLGMLAVALVFGMAVVGCSDDSTDENEPQKVSYESKDAAGNTYHLTITENMNRAAYSAQTGDSYELKIIPVSGTTKISRGTIQVVNDGNITCMPSGSTVPFSITFTNGNMTGISGTITLIGGETEAAPAGNLTLDGNSGNQTGEDTTFDPQQLVGKWQALSWETLLSENSSDPQKVVGFEYLTQEKFLFTLRSRSTDGGGSTSLEKSVSSVSHNIFYFHNPNSNQTIPLFSCSISGETLTLTAITVGYWFSGWDINAGEVFFVGNKVVKYDWEN